jgi:hypothetical protein
MVFNCRSQGVRLQFIFPRIFVGIDIINGILFLQTVAYRETIGAATAVIGTLAP